MQNSQHQPKMKPLASEHSSGSTIYRELSPKRSDSALKVRIKLQFNPCLCSRLALKSRSRSECLNIPLHLVMSGLLTLST